MHSLFFSSPLFTHELSSTGKANVFESEQSYLIEIEAPGFSKDDFTITAGTNNLQIEANRVVELPEGYNLHSRESQISALKRQFRFRKSIDAETIEAKSNNGILSLHIPKKEVRRIEVQAV